MATFLANEMQLTLQGERAKARAGNLLADDASDQTEVFQHHL